MTKKLVVAVDCDDVIISTMPLFLDMYNKTYGTQGELHQVHMFDSDIWGAEKDFFKQRWFDITKTSEYKELVPDPEGVAVLRTLAEKHEIHLVTARKDEEKAFTQELLRRYVGDIFSSMQFVGWEGSKGSVCQALQADVFIDDLFQHLSSAYDCGIKNLIWFGGRPWQTEDPGDVPVVCCRSWQEVETEIGRITAS